MGSGKPPVKGEGGAEENKGAVTGGAQGKSAKQSKAKSKSKGIEYVIDPGIRTERGYPVTKDEIWLLGSVGVGATGLFSLASALFGYYVNVSLGLVFSSSGSSPALPALLAWYDASRESALIASIVAGICGLIVAGLGVLKARSIISRTKFEGDDV